MMRITTDPETRRDLKAGLRWSIVLGILMIVAGVLAIIEPFTAAIAITVFVGFIFLLHGIFNTIFAFTTRYLGAGWFILQVLLGLLYLMAGAVLLKQPFQGMVTLTLIAGILIFIDGVVQVIGAFDMKPLYGWGWALLSGILGVILGIAIWSGWPQNSEWLLGILIGVNLVTNGWAVFMTSTAIRASISDDAPASSEDALT